MTPKESVTCESPRLGEGLSQRAVLGTADLGGGVGCVRHEPDGQLEEWERGAITQAWLQLLPPFA